MIQILPESEGNTLAIRAIDKLTDADYKEVLIPRLEAIIKEKGKAKFLFDLGEEFHGFEAAALWDDAIFGVNHMSDFEKVAVVGGPRWVYWATKLASLMMSGEVKTFPQGQLHEAWQWLGS